MTSIKLGGLGQPSTYEARNTTARKSTRGTSLHTAGGATFPDVRRQSTLMEKASCHIQHLTASVTEGCEKYSFSSNFPDSSFEAHMEIR
ncbi:uncharacterized protein DS421_4g120700 [Arachis hypogaea]|nr:uncharacterized protein DS421_4g120700 [Arachis hypogaea]